MVYRCTIEKDGKEYIAQFPDMPNIITCGFSRDEALAMAKEALDNCLVIDISQGNIIPKPSFKRGYPITIANHINVALQLRELQSEQNETDEQITYVFERELNW